MGDDARDAVELAIRQACEQQDYERAATLAVERYGGEILAFLTAQLGDPDDAGDAFSRFSERFWKALPNFEWRCSARTWAYKLARHAAADHHRHEHKHARQVPLSGASRLSQAVVAVRSATAEYQRTAVKDRFQLLREQLPQEDQLVLILRVDRGLSWLELAEVMHAGPEAPTSEALQREAARLRKRFQLIRARLRELARAEGIID